MHLILECVMLIEMQIFISWILESGEYRNFKFCVTVEKQIFLLLQKRWDSYM